MRNRTWQIASVFGVCLAVLFAALGWASWKIVQLERAEADAARKAVFEENVRLALWRMDSSLAPLIAQENARPYFSYAPFYAAERAYNAMYGQWRKGEVLIPSNLLAFQSPSVKIHFQLDPAGILTSPQAPTGNMRDLAESNYLPPSRVRASWLLLSELRSSINWQLLRTRLPKQNAFICPSAMGCDVSPPPPIAAQRSEAVQTMNDSGARQSEKGAAEFKRRAESSAQNSNFSKMAEAPPAMPKTVREGWMRATWVNDKLLLVRRVLIEEKEYLQGCWLDWHEIEKIALELVKDLLPEARLEPLADMDKPLSTRSLASLPAALLPGEAFEDPIAGPSPVRWSLVFAWSGALLAAIAVGSVVAGLIALGERRAAFVSAVTHELRTPLTTFRLYADMLERGMVDTPEQRQEYFGTMRKEADRLGHLVENVLTFSRLERGRPKSNPQVVAVAAVLDRCWPRFVERAAAAGMVMVRAQQCDESMLCIAADPVAVEQVLFNLIDNASKYAQTATDKRIVVGCSDAGRQIAIDVQDFGPGIAPGQVRKLFRPFSKSAEQAAQSQPGVGLGLALSRRIAKSLGGNLEFDRRNLVGAKFVLLLPNAGPMRV